MQYQPPAECRILSRGKKNLYPMKKDPFLFTLVKVSIVKLPRSGVFFGSKTAFGPKAAATPVFIPTHYGVNIILFEKTARCQVIITSVEGAVDSPSSTNNDLIPFPILIWYNKA
jgi:hypothetical protein